MKDFEIFKIVDDTLVIVGKIQYQYKPTTEMIRQEFKIDEDIDILIREIY